MPKKVLFSESVISRIISESLLEATASEIRSKYYQDVPEQDYKQLIFVDPTSNPNKDKMGKYGKWILSLYKQGNVKVGDVPELKDSLTYFDKFKGKLERKDINQYHSVPELYNAIKPFMDNPNQATSKSDELRKTKQEGAEKVYEDDEWLVVVPKTEQAACLYGKGTKWCTAATDGDNMFSFYNERGPLYVNINKKTGRKYQFHFQTNQFMDEQDKQIGTNIPKKIGMSQGLYDFYSSDSKRFPLAKLIFRFGNVMTFENYKGNDTVVFFTKDEDGSNYEGWLDERTGDSLTGDKLFLACQPFAHNRAPYRDLDNGQNVMTRNGTPLFKQNLQRSFSFSGEDFGGKIFKVVDISRDNTCNFVNSKGQLLFEHWLLFAIRIENQIYLGLRNEGKIYSAVMDLNGNLVRDWSDNM